MLFKAFRIKNYKSFIDSGECSVQNGVTIFAGQNESGKSNVLSALVKINDKTPTFNTDEYCFGQTESPEIVYNFELSDAERSELAVAFPDVEIHNDVCVVVKDKNRCVICNIVVDDDKSNEGIADIEFRVNQHVEQYLPKFDKLDAKEREIIIRRYVDGMRVEDAYKSLSISRATAFRRLEAGLMHMADLYRELYEQAA